MMHHLSVCPDIALEVSNVSAILSNRWSGKSPRGSQVVLTYHQNQRNQKASVFGCGKIVDYLSESSRSGYPDRRPWIQNVINFDNEVQSNKQTLRGTRCMYTQSMTTEELIMSDYSNHSHMIQYASSTRYRSAEKSFDLRYCC
jgi:hypothetical protein